MQLFNLNEYVYFVKVLNKNQLSLLVTVISNDVMIHEKASFLKDIFRSINKKNMQRVLGESKNIPLKSLLIS